MHIDFSKPIEELEQAIEDSEDAPAWFALMLGCVKAGKAEAADGWYREMYDCDMMLNFTEEQALMANTIHDVISNLEEIQATKAALEKKPDDIELLFKLGLSCCGFNDTWNTNDRWLYLELGWLDEAEHIFSTILQREPANENARHNLEGIRKEKRQIKNSD